MLRRSAVVQRTPSSKQLKKEIEPEVDKTKAQDGNPGKAKVDDHKKSSTSETDKISTTLHYNIQIHLPPTKDIEVFNAIFKALKEHLLE